MIKCGSYVGAVGRNVNLGFEPQLVIAKKSSGAGHWVLHDSVRGDGKEIKPNLNQTETDENGFVFNSTGFNFTDDSDQFNGTGSTYIYMAIRKP